MGTLCENKILVLRKQREPTLLALLGLVLLLFCIADYVCNLNEFKKMFNLIFIYFS